MMVSCPGCNNNYSIDERKLPAKGGSLTCRECGTKWHVTAPREDSGPQPVKSEPDSSAPTPAPSPASSLSFSDSSGSIALPVTCPQCGHLFTPARGASGPAPRRARRTPKILLIEDQNYFAELTREALADGYETTVVTNVSGAREAMAHEKFELVILDLSLEEGQDGFQLLGMMRKAGIPVLVFTARDETELYGGVWDNLKVAGATDILIKGVNVGEELRQKVQSLLK